MPVFDRPRIELGTKLLLISAVDSRSRPPVNRTNLSLTKVISANTELNNDLC